MVPRLLLHPGGDTKADNNYKFAGNLEVIESFLSNVVLCLTGRNAHHNIQIILLVPGEYSGIMTLQLCHRLCRNKQNSRQAGKPKASLGEM